MKEYIDVEVLKKQDFQDYSNTDVEYAIDHCPRADVVEVVRCKDCKYASRMLIFNGIKSEYVIRCNGFLTDIDFCGDNGFCSYGERREQE